jgi:protein phosphatase
MLVDKGQLAPCDITSSGVAHILTNAIGGSSEKVDVDVDLLRLEDGDRVLLCSDGLTDLVDDEEIAATLAAMKTSQDACAELVRQALGGGGRDNITVIVGGYTLPDEAAQEAAESA